MFRILLLLLLSTGPRCSDALWGVQGESGAAHSPCGAGT